MRIYFYVVTGLGDYIPPAYVKTRKDSIFYYYAKLVVCDSAGFKGKGAQLYKMTWHVFNKLKTGKMKMSDRNREYRKQMLSKNVCAYCGEPSNALDHVLARRIGGPEGALNEVKSCRKCNSSKGKKDLVAWWLMRHHNADDIPRVPIGIYLKYSYEWNRLNDSLDVLANGIEDLRPFKSGK